MKYLKAKYLKVKAFFTKKKEEGAAMVEYALLVALIALACIIALTQLGTTMRKLFQGVASTMSTIPSNAR